MSKSKTTYSGDIKTLLGYVMDDLIAKGVIKTKSMSAYQKTEQLLSNYMAFKEAIADRQEQIEEIKQYGLKKTSMSIIPMPQEGGAVKYKETEEEKEDKTIRAIESSMERTRKCIDLVDRALERISNDKFAGIISAHYLNGESLDDIALRYNRDVSSVRRHRARLVRRLSTYLFSDDVINELYS